MVHGDIMWEKPLDFKTGDGIMTPLNVFLILLALLIPTRLVTNDMF